MYTSKSAILIYIIFHTIWTYVYNSFQNIIQMYNLDNLYCAKNLILDLCCSKLFLEGGLGGGIQHLLSHWRVIRRPADKDPLISSMGLTVQPDIVGGRISSHTSSLLPTFVFWTFIYLSIQTTNCLLSNYFNLINLSSKISSPKFKMTPH